ncbi:MAG TPA: hypothetical protein VH092_20405 [Urbifossiella sp.]|jgi:hypothetical protein|nr:hypothetical protein [Urbifossiella sp.]
MADGRDPAPGFSFRATFPWMEIFRCFQVALDPRKLLVAAAGILAMSFGWYILSVSFYYQAPQRSSQEYSNATYLKKLEGQKKPGTDAFYTEADAAEKADKQFATDLEQWKVLADLAGPYGQTDPVTKLPVPVGRFRAMPWDEYRGPNPFLFATNVLSGSATERADAISRFISGSIPVLVEPLVKLLVPVAKMVSPGVSPLTRVYLFFLIVWNVAVWAFFGGVITRLAAVALANKGPITLKQAVRFVAVRYVNYVLSPMVPLAIVGAVIVGLCVYGFLALIPVIGDLALLGLLLPLVLVGGAIMAVFLVGLVGYPLMYPTLSVEGDSSDTFDALSRSVNYVYQSPWHYLWNWLVAVVYGAAVTFFVLFFTSLTVYVAKWAVGLPASAVWSDRKPEYLFIYAPESFGWKELLLQDSPYAVTHSTAVSPTGRIVDVYVKKDPAEYDRNRAEYYWYNTWGAGLVAFWLALMFLMMLGFSYSFFWTAAVAIYFLMRKRVDEAEPDEVFLEDDEPEAPMAPPKPADAAPAPAGTSLPVITAPAAPPVVPPAPPVFPPPPPPVVAVSPPVVPPAPPPVVTPEPKPVDAPKPDDTPPVV